MTYSELISSLSADMIANGRKVSISNFMSGYVFYPGIRVCAQYRIAKYLNNKNLLFKLMSKIIWRRMVSQSGCHLSMLANIGPGMSLPHPIGIVVGEGVNIGPRARLYQNVTIGKMNSGYPTLGSDCVAHPGAVIAGGIEIGDHCTIGALSYVSKSATAGSLLVGSPAREIPSRAASIP
jgi:serine O-acetyltransferase